MTIAAEHEVLSATEVDLGVDWLIEQFDSGEELVEDVAEPAAAPLFRVEKGNPTDEEIAVLACVFAAAAQAAANVQQAPPNRWGSRERKGNPAFTDYSFPEMSHLRA
ncbi:acyl-CoA carboxylase epsilon subunit-like protein [Nocardia tenerifensis]|uniref:Acyl-CoA carboxylase epsilon subunit-like protein n=1 Tax=Nocardia tenerifensis TaxID=228006 RepID=A0A318KH34_9NOCA|nr:acyl-CoA carboxylase subunit epsilon [Nocardia tenerifensis]PXX71572.1 acyl-CoA carboxylase epsilon subunit-like protein [Nocardia tenerifensis]